MTPEVRFLTAWRKWVLSFGAVLYLLSGVAAGKGCKEVGSLLGCIGNLPVAREMPRRDAKVQMVENCCAVVRGNSDGNWGGE